MIRWPPQNLLHLSGLQRSPKAQKPLANCRQGIWLRSPSRQREGLRSLRVDGQNQDWCNWRRKRLGLRSWWSSRVMGITAAVAIPEVDRGYTMAPDFCIFLLDGFETEFQNAAKILAISFQERLTWFALSAGAGILVGVSAAITVSGMQRKKERWTSVESWRKNATRTLRVSDIFGCLGVSNFSLVAGLQQHREQRRTNRLVLYMHENHWKHDKMLRKFVQLIQQANDRPCSAGETSPIILHLVLLFKSNHVLYCSLLDNRNHDVPWSAQKNWYTCNCNMKLISRNIKPKHFKRSSHLNHDDVATIQLIVEIG